MRLLLRLLWPLLAAMFLAAAPALGEADPPEKLLSFADFLFQQEDYYRAITEYERFAFLYPGHPQANAARLQVALCYLKGEKPEQAVGRLRALAQGLPGDEVADRSRFLLGEAMDQKRDFAGAAEEYGRYLEANPQGGRADSARLARGWSLLRQGEWEKAGRELETVPEGSPLRPRAQGLAAEAPLYAQLPRKSPTAAGILSGVLPGAGQVYVGRGGDALISFVLNGLFILAIKEANENDDHATAGILLFFETGWYTGNIYNAVSGAHKANARARQEFLDGLQKRHGLALSADGAGGATVAYTVDF